MTITSLQLARARGFTLLEVMIAVAILATALSAVGSLLYTMHLSRTALEEEIKVQAITQLMCERLQGAKWDNLGKDFGTQSAWSWHRRASPQSAYPPPPLPATGFNPPLQEDPSVPDEHNLQKLGLLSDRSGVPDLKIYVEYYQMDLYDKLNQELAKVPSPDPRETWFAAVGNPDPVLLADPGYKNKGPTWSEKNNRTIYLPENPAVFDLSQLDPAIVIRVVVTWKSSAGGTRWHEAVIARRK